jgi:DNA topoisomerase-1
LDITLSEALELLAQPRYAGRGRTAPREPLRVFEASPVTEQPIKLLDGRYGPYVTDGQTNASLPKGVTPDEVTFEQAVQLLAERAAKGTTGRSRGRKKAKAKKAAPRKKAAKKKAAKKKTAKKKTAGRKKTS